MLANSSIQGLPIGALSGDIPRPESFRVEMLDFIAASLPVWRDRPDRPKHSAETVLTSQVCAHLNSAARRTKGWDILQFRVEEPDESVGGRKTDLAVAPSGTCITIAGRRHTDFDTLMPVECKRLPTPKGAHRDEREYVISAHSTTGGIQRFKAGHHAKAHQVAAMIGYVQEGSAKEWDSKIAGWISALAGNEDGWTDGDLLAIESVDAKARVTRLSSKHARQKGLPEIELRHVWIEMDS